MFYLSSSKRISTLLSNRKVLKIKILWILIFIWHACLYFISQKNNGDPVKSFFRMPVLNYTEWQFIPQKLQNLLCSLVQSKSRKFEMWRIFCQISVNSKRVYVKEFFITLIRHFLIMCLNEKITFCKQNYGLISTNSI